MKCLAVTVAIGFFPRCAVLIDEQDGERSHDWYGQVPGVVDRQFVGSQRQRGPDEDRLAQFDRHIELMRKPHKARLAGDEVDRLRPHARLIDGKRDLDVAPWRWPALRTACAK